MSALFETIKQDMVAAMKAGKKDHVGTLRMLVSAIKNEQINDRGKQLADQDVSAVIKREIKKRNDSIEQYRAAGRTDLADQEQGELAILSAYMPTGPSEADVVAVVDEVLGSMEAPTAKDFGVIMKQVMGKFSGNADGAVIARLLRAKLSTKP